MVNEPDFVILGNPVIKKNSRPIHVNRTTGRPFIGKSEKLSSAETDALAQFQIQKMQFSEEFPIKYRLHVRFMFYRNNHAHVDLSNLYEFPQDCLQEAGIIENDTLIESHDGSRKRYDKKNPRTEIYISLFEDDGGSSVPDDAQKEEDTVCICRAVDTSQAVATHHPVRAQEQEGFQEQLP